MELLQLEPPDYGVRIMGIYLIDDDGIGVCAGPFDSETAAIGWIDQRRENVGPLPAKQSTDSLNYSDRPIFRI
jgi:hypothetical protein